MGVVGGDFPMADLDLLRSRDVDLAGLEVAEGPSFRWRGRYHLDMNHRDTLDLQLGVFADFRPRLPETYLDSEVVFLAYTPIPICSVQVLGRPASGLTACDTIDHWITEKRAAVDELFSRVDIVFLNEDEARLYADTRTCTRPVADPGPGLPRGVDQEG